MTLPLFPPSLISSLLLPTLGTGFLFTPFLLFFPGPLPLSFEGASEGGGGGNGGVGSGGSGSGNNNKGDIGKAGEEEGGGVLF